MAIILEQIGRRIGLEPAPIEESNVILAADPWKVGLHGREQRTFQDWTATVAHPLRTWCDLRNERRGIELRRNFGRRSVDVDDRATANDYSDPISEQLLGLAADVLRPFGSAFGGRHLADLDLHLSLHLLDGETADYYDAIIKMSAAIGTERTGGRYCGNCSKLPGMAITVEELATQLNAEAARRRISPDALLDEIATQLPDTEPDDQPARRKLAFAGIGASTAGRNARDIDEILAEGFGRS